ncbi:bifunctional precorrin-2 dehydrogenase/sirohydrochlorin ferrochelatase [Herpetosiphon gulosus]|uniref:precorrin-2 dehydrogenase n=1 Tax=Herpetosiphon gulosus TaxID=1973496 RepID=A0ABP9WZZ3_9CHLR
MYPIVLTNLAQQRCVVIGGGAVAERKVAGLIAGGAKPIVISPQLTPQLQHWQASSQIQHIAREYQFGDCEQAFLVVAATNQRLVNQQIAQECHNHSILLNIADAAEEGNFITTANHRQGSLLFSVSSSGASPALSRYLRQQLSTYFDQRYATLAQIVAGQRTELAALSTAEREQYFDQLLIELAQQPTTLNHLPTEDL